MLPDALRLSTPQKSFKLALRQNGMPKETWIIGSILTVALLLALLGFNAYERKQEVERAHAELEQLRAAAAQDKGLAAELKDKLAESQARIDELQKENERAVQGHKSLEDEMRSALESKDVTISQLQGKLTVNILDRVLFDSGEAELKPDGEAILRKVVEVLAQHPRVSLHVIGHTDNVPIRAGARSRFPSNWELSTARATAAVRFLSEKAGVDPRRLGAVGYGEFRPVADNATAEGRARNRRIAITVLSEELAGADVGSGTVTNSVSPTPALQTNGTQQTVHPAPGAEGAKSPQD
jgi:chemotaxis protein MotB